MGAERHLTDFCAIFALNLTALLKKLSNKNTVKVYCESPAAMRIKCPAQGRNILMKQCG